MKNLTDKISEYNTFQEKIRHGWWWHILNQWEKKMTIRKSENYPNKKEQESKLYINK